MIIERKEENMDPKIVRNFSNKDLIVEESRKSRLLCEDKKRIMNSAFTDNHKYYNTKQLSELLRKAVYQMNFDRAMQHELFCSVNSVLVELYHVKDKNKHLEEAEKWLSNVFELMVFLGQSDAERFLHDETTDGWHHPETVSEKPEGVK